MRKLIEIAKGITILFSALFLVILSFYIQWVPADQNQQIDGTCPENIKAICHPVGGFPIPYVKDDETVSVVGVLDFFEDHFFVHWFFIDFAFYYLLIWFLLNSLFRCKKNLE